MDGKHRLERPTYDLSGTNTLMSLTAGTPMRQASMYTKARERILDSRPDSWSVASSSGNGRDVGWCNCVVSVSVCEYEI